MPKWTDDEHLVLDLIICAVQDQESRAALSTMKSTSE